MNGPPDDAGCKTLGNACCRTAEIGTVISWQTADCAAQPARRLKKISIESRHYDAAPGRITRQGRSVVHRRYGFCLQSFSSRGASIHGWIDVSSTSVRFCCIRVRCCLPLRSHTWQAPRVQRLRMPTLPRMRQVATAVQCRDDWVGARVRMRWISTAIRIEKSQRSHFVTDARRQTCRDASRPPAAGPAAAPDDTEHAFDPLASTTQGHLPDAARLSVDLWPGRGWHWSAPRRIAHRMYNLRRTLATPSSTAADKLPSADRCCRSAVRTRASA